MSSRECRLAAFKGSDVSQVQARSLKKQLDELKTNVPPVRLPGKNLVLTAPSLLAEVEYRAWTRTGKLRHPSFKGHREAEDSAEVYGLSD